MSRNPATADPEHELAEDDDGDDEIMDDQEDGYSTCHSLDP